jgi:bacillolysin
MPKLFVAALIVLVGILTSLVPSAQSAIQTRSLTATATFASATLRDADRTITAMARAGELERLATFADVLVPGREHQRFQQVVNGVPVWASTITRQLDAAGLPVSVFGEVYEGLEAVDTTARLSPNDARTIVAKHAGVELGDVPAPLYVLVTPDGPRLVFVVRAATLDLSMTQYFIDATAGTIVLKRNDTKRQNVGTGVGVFGPEKKISTTQQGGTFIAADDLRPPVLETFNFRGNPFAVVQFLNGIRGLFASDYASDGDNRWTDPATVDAHVYAGWTYDYFFKRHHRLGLDDRNLPIVNIVHPVNRSDASLFGDVVPEYFINAGYYGGGVMVYGEGVSFPVDGQSYDYLSGGLDVVAHELTHGVTDYTSQLEYQDEPGALNEAFSDMMATSVEFYFQPQGAGRGEADYLLGEDVVRPGGFRSMSTPTAFGQPDHYSRLVKTTDDNGGVHINSGIPNQAFFLAIEGGRNETSGLTVVGVGGANREQIEKVFYRAFTMLPRLARFSTARAATIQSAQDLYGAGSPAERAVSQAWTAVGVF